MRARRAGRWLVATMAAVMAVGALDQAGAGAGAGKLLFAEDFERLPLATWADGSSHGQWTSVYNGYGRNGIVSEAGSGKVLSLSPAPSSHPDETHGGLATSNKVISGNIDLNVRLKTVSQSRTPVPNPWETAWVLWNFTDDHHFYYLALKTNGWELAKEDPTVLVRDPSRPADCEWPTYNNCKYEGAQRYLRTSSSPQFPVGQWYSVRIVQKRNVITVWANGQLLTSFTDTETPYTSGKIGLYTEDSHVLFSDVRAARPS